MQAADDVSDGEDINDTSPLLGNRVEESNDTSYTYGRPPLPASELEPADVYRSRWRSIRVVYLVMFLGSVTFTITMSSLWPFLLVLNPEVSTDFLGWVVAAYSLGQLVASPIFGSWANLRNSSREPLAVSLVLTVLSNIFYTYLESVPLHRDYFMILARGLIGFSAGNVAVVRSYVAGATTVQERTATMANLSIFQAMGFILGPVIQAALVPISYPGPVPSEFFHFNMYTAPAFLAACIAIISVLLLIFVFREHRAYDDDVRAVLQSQAGNLEDQNNINNSDMSDSLRQLTYKLDYVAVFSSILLFFVVLFMFTVFETIGTPLTMHMYAWTKSKATLYLGIILGVASILSIVVFLLVKILAKKYNERYLLLYGFIFCLCGYFTFIPWGSHLPPTGFAPIYSNQTVSSADAIFSLSDFIFKGGHIDSVHYISKRDAFFRRNQSGLKHMVIFNRDIYRGDNSNYSSIINSTGRTSFVYIDDSVQTNVHTKGLASTPSSFLLLTTNMTTPTNKTATQINTSKTTTINGDNLPFTALAESPTITSSTTNTTEASNGCPWQYTWCRYVPAIYLGQFLGGTVLISIGYPVCNMLSYALYSKVLGPKPQGLWMGWLTASGSLARTVGPIYVSQVYDSFGPQITFGSCAGLILLTIVFYLVVFRRMVPFSFKNESLTRFGGSISKRSVN